mgnify:CR=1 FL=1
MGTHLMIGRALTVFIVPAQHLLERLHQRRNTGRDLAGIDAFELARRVCEHKDEDSKDKDFFENTHRTKPVTLSDRFSRVGTRATGPAPPRPLWHERL